MNEFSPDRYLQNIKAKYLPKKVNIYRMLGYSPQQAVHFRKDISKRLTCIKSKFDPRKWPKITDEYDKNIVKWHYYLCRDILQLFENEDTVPLMAYNHKWKQYYQYDDNNAENWKEYWPFHKIPKVFNCISIDCNIIN